MPNRANGRQIHRIISTMPKRMRASKIGNAVFVFSPRRPNHAATLASLLPPDDNVLLQHDAQRVTALPPLYVFPGLSDLAPHDLLVDVNWSSQSVQKLLPGLALPEFTSEDCVHNRLVSVFFHELGTPLLFPLLEQYPADTKENGDNRRDPHKNFHFPFPLALSP